jgi:hypothetical protein
MKRIALFASGPLLALAIVAGCRGSVDRVYDDGITAPPEGGSVESGTSTLDGGKEHSDGSADGGVLLTSPATIHVEVRGLSGSGLVLENNGGDALPIAAEGSFSFTTLIGPGQPYKVTVANQPTAPTQNCSISNGEGVAAGKDIDVGVACATATYPVGGTVVGLDPNVSVTLQNNGGADVTVNGNLPFTFPAVQSGKGYNVTFKSSTPAGTSCTVSGGSGTVVGAAVDSVVVNCGKDTYTIGGTVTGLTGTLVLTNNGGNDRSVTASSFAFSVPIKSGNPYNVQVKTQPAYPPQQQVCTVTKGTGTVGTANVTDVAVDCVTSKYTVGGTVNGLTGAGLKLRNNGGDDKSINVPGGSFSFLTPIGSGSSYNVTVITQPAGQACTVTNPTGTITTAAVSNVVVSCATPIALEEHFDGVQDPALPAGWTTQALTNTNVTLANKWTTVSDPGAYVSAPNAAFIENVGDYRDVVLTSPSFQVASSTAKLTFWNHIESEVDWDGGVLEIAIGGGAWQDILAAGGTFNGGTGYNATLDNGAGASTLGGHLAWNGRVTQNASVNLPASCAGKSVQLRWRFVSDDGASDNGWWIDDVVVTN